MLHFYSIRNLSICMFLFCTVMNTGVCPIAFTLSTSKNIKFSLLITGYYYAVFSFFLVDFGDDMLSVDRFSDTDKNESSLLAMASLYKCLRSFAMFMALTLAAKCSNDCPLMSIMLMSVSSWKYKYMKEESWLLATVFINGVINALSLASLFTPCLMMHKYIMALSSPLALATCKGVCPL